jgi:multidrug resistance protein, MATE family
LTDVIDDGAVVGAPVTETLATPLAGGPELLTGRVSRALLWLAVPVLAEQFLNLLVALVDTYLAGTVSKEATAAIGLAAQVSWLVGLLFSLIGAGATALVSRHAGMRLTDRANHFSNQSIAAAAIMGLMGMGLVLLLAPVLPRMLDWDPLTSQITIRYLQIDAIGYGLFSITAIAAACWRGMGDTRTPLYVMTVVNMINVIVSASLRFGWGPVPEMGVSGIAVGTVVARSLGGLIVIWLLIRGRSGLRFRRPDLRFRGESMRRLLRVGVPAGVDGSLLWIGQFLFLIIISQLGTGEEQSAIVAAHFIGIRVEALSYLPAFAWATAAATMVGQSLGAGDRRRASRSGHLAAMQGTLMCVAMGVLYFAFAPQIYAAFSAHGDQAMVTAIGVPALRLLAFFQAPLALMIIYTNALRGAGDVRYPVLFTVVGTMLVRLPLAYLLGVVLEGGLLGAWIGMCVDMTIRAVLSGVRFVRGRWQHIQV